MKKRERERERVEEGEKEARKDEEGIPFIFVQPRISSYGRAFTMLEYMFSTWVVVKPAIRVQAIVNRQTGSSLIKPIAYIIY